VSLAAKRKKGFALLLLAAVGAELVMVFGYFAFSALLLGNGLAAAASIPGDLVQGTVGIILFLILRTLLTRIFPKGLGQNK